MRLEIFSRPCLTRGVVSGTDEKLVVNQMRRVLKRVEAWRVRKRQRSLQWWERERANGKTRFVFRFGLTYGLTIVGLNDVYANLFNGGTQYFDFYSAAFWYLFFGIIIGSSAWENWESKYQNALHEASKAPPGGKTLS